MSLNIGVFGLDGRQTNTTVLPEVFKAFTDQTSYTRSV